MKFFRLAQSQHPRIRVAGMHLRASAAALPLLCAMIAPGSARAQETPPEAVEAPPAQADIIVTANKRSQRLADVGLAIQAISGDLLRTQRVNSLADFAAQVPGLSYTPTSQSTPVYTLRGVGFYESSLPNYPSVSMYQDEAPLPFPAMTSHAVFDLERIEVLKGPQGTLYGQNATAGAINLIAAKPTSRLEAGASFTYGSFERIEGSAYVSGPLSDTLSARAAIEVVNSSGWQRSYTRNDKLGDNDYIVGRVLLAWKPASNFRLNLSVDAWQDKSDPQAPQLQSLLPQSPATLDPGIYNYPFPPDNDARAADWSPQSRPFADNRFWKTTVRADWDISSGLTLTAISSYAKYLQKQRIERSGTTFLVDEIALDTGKIESFNQELRLSNGSGGALRWVIGGNYEHSNVFEEARSAFKDISTAPIFGYTGAISSTDQKLRNYALFANAEYALGAGVTVKGGIRYTKADRHATLCTRDPGDNSFGPVFDGLVFAIQNGFIPLEGFTPTGEVPPPVGAGCAALDNVTSDGTPVTYLPGAYTTELNEDNVSWRAGIDYKTAPDLLFYANVAKGYKAGSLPLASAATFAQYQAVTQESLMSYEAGFKFQTRDRMLSIDGAAFYYDYTNKQLRSKIVDPIFGLLDALDNVPKSRLIGAELEATLRPAPGLTITANAMYIDSKIKVFSGYSSSGQITDYAGAKIPYTPDFQLNASFDYQWTMGSVEPFLGASVVTRSSAFANIGGDKGFTPLPNFRTNAPVGSLFRIPSYTVLDLRAGVRAGPWSLSVFAKNVTDTYYLTNIYTQYDTINRLTGRPRTFGATIAYRFQ